MKWLKEKLKNWLFKDEIEYNRRFEHRIINVPAEVITLRSVHEISDRQLMEIKGSSGLDNYSIMEKVKREMMHELISDLERGGFFQFESLTKGSIIPELETKTVITCKLMVVKPKM